MSKSLICFDVDGTLVDNKTSWLTLTQGLGCSIPQVLSIYDRVMQGRISFAEGEKLVTQLYRSTGKATKDNIQKIFDKEVLKPGAVEITRFLKNKGYAIWLISGAIDIYVESIAAKVGADGFFASASLEFDKDEILSNINYGGNQSVWKAQMVRELAGKFGLAPSDIIFVGDSENDISAFELTGKGVAVQPYDERLDKVLWRKVGSLAQIQKIVESGF